jgi:predicted metallopeptidase
MVKYEYSPSLQALTEDVAKRLFPNIVTSRIKCYRSYDVSVEGVIARCHGLGKLMQAAMDVKGFYALEFIGEKFNDLSTEEKVKVVIHELMHIPEHFGGEFRHHDVVTDENVELAYKDYLDCRKNDLSIDWFKKLKSREVNKK